MKAPNDKKKQVNHYRAMGCGVELAVAVGFCTWVGYQADQSYDTSPIWTLTGLLLSIVGGLYNLIRQVLKD